MVQVSAVRDFPGYYVSKCGKVYSKWKTRKRAEGGRGVESYISNKFEERKLQNQRAGYFSILLRKDGEYHNRLVHRLVLETFVGPCPEGMECRHLDGNKHNNSIDNLCWGTKAENAADKVLHGTDRAGTEAAALVNRGRARTFTKEHKQNISAAAKKRFEDPEQSQAASDNHWTKGENAEGGKAKMIASLTGRTLSEDHKAAISASGKGKKRSDEQKQHYSDGHWTKGPNAAEIMARRSEKTRLKREAKLQAALNEPNPTTSLLD